MGGSDERDVFNKYRVGQIFFLLVSFLVILFLHKCFCIFYDVEFWPKVVHSSLIILLMPITSVVIINFGKSILIAFSKNQVLALLVFSSFYFVLY